MESTYLPVSEKADTAVGRISDGGRCAPLAGRSSVEENIASDAPARHFGRARGKVRRFAILLNNGLYAGVDFGALSDQVGVRMAQLIVTEGHRPLGSVDGWPVATWGTRKRADECLAWLADAGIERGARVVEVRPAWEVVA